MQCTVTFSSLATSLSSEGSIRVTILERWDSTHTVSSVAASVRGPLATGTMARIPGGKLVTFGLTMVWMEEAAARGTSVETGVEARVAPHPDTRMEDSTIIMNL